MNGFFVGGGDDFTASANNQFGNPIADADVNWSVADPNASTDGSGDAGTINSAGWYDAPTDNSGTFTITASSGMGPSNFISAAASVIVPVSTPALTATEGTDGTEIDVSWAHRRFQRHRLYLRSQALRAGRRHESLRHPNGARECHHDRGDNRHALD